jgi:hypothetical protein
MLVSFGRERGVFLSVMNGEGWIAELHAQRSFCTLGEV